MKRLLLAAALAGAGVATAVPASADVTVCAGRATLVVAGVTVLDQELGCHTVDTP